MFTWWEICYEVLLKFLPKMLPGETVQIGPNFPAKSLSIYNKTFSLHPIY